MSNEFPDYLTSGQRDDARPDADGDHVIPEVRLDQTAALLANAVVYALGGFAGDDPDRRVAALMIFLHELAAKIKDRKALRAIFVALMEEIDG